MKKILLACGAAALALSIASCDSSKKSAGNDELAALGDSLSTVAGEANGSTWLMQYKQVPADERSKFSKSGIIKGVETMVLADTTDQGFLVGINIGQQLMQNLYRLEAAGVPVDRKTFMAEFKKAFNGDSVSEQQMMLLQGKFSEMSRRAMQLAEEKKEAAAAETPEAKANIEAGEKYITTAKAEDPAIVTTPSGLNYKVVKEGEGAQVGAKGRAVVNYKGKLVDGTEFDAGEGARFSTANVIPGFAEGLAMMQKGGVYTLIIPADLGYGSKSMGTIPPMSTLIFEVEVVDVEPAE
ncbi:MAG: FKBP-type peptidyl-prolyl cis-trans isomerase [Duncaniella sp.]|nr:FKBP-type peptidyl-prolyl cis-trans isomerase [Duncaniella sp.]